MNEDKTYEVYIVTNTVNGKLYVGQTSIGYMKRWYWHCNLAKNNGRTIMSHAIRKYGPDGFSLAVYAHGLTREGADRLERELIKSLGTTNRGCGYNSTEGGEGGSQSIEVRKIMSDRKKGRPPGWQTGPDREIIQQKINVTRTRKLPVEEVISLYVTGMSTCDIAEKFDCGSGTISNRLKEAGITIRSSEERGYLSAKKCNSFQFLPDNTGSKRSEETKAKMRQSNAMTRRDVTDNEVVTLYLRGYSTVVIGRQFDMSSYGVRARLLKNNVKLRRHNVRSR